MDKVSVTSVLEENPSPIVLIMAHNLVSLLFKLTAT